MLVLAWRLLSLRGSVHEMCELGASMDALGAQVDEAVAAEALPMVCSAPECDGVPVMRLAPSADAADLLCADCLFGFGVSVGVRAMIEVIEPAGIRVDKESAGALASFSALR